MYFESKYICILILLLLDNTKNNYSIQLIKKNKISNIKNSHSFIYVTNVNSTMICMRKMR